MEQRVYVCVGYLEHRVYVCWIFDLRYVGSSFGFSSSAVAGVSEDACFGAPLSGLSWAQQEQSEAHFDLLR